MSPPFLYENTNTHRPAQTAVTDSKSRHGRVTQYEHERIEASWRERALNAEEQKRN
ncbi:hypothetical protein KQY30_35595 [Streptomyces sp. GMY02]|uniref:hypothetical protein n=1 Tax=Streptomyces sp. GMY02 TaxID=1333528 RepID=UPI001C2BE69B|nr:hypothetical protein [Streptomyces sp. GMY02]QXE38747.1 hypothetical protein KQY30_35595 [Streptomyces sp. GMY02]